MTNALDGLSPKILWELFGEISQQPRSSGKEEKIRAYLKEFAAKHSFETREDSVGNIVIIVPATPGHENAPTVVLQGHMDMVCEKNEDVEFNFDTDPIRLVRDGEWLKAYGTTLGADNGIGLAAGLAAAIDPEVVHGPLELLCTVDEETGLTGAFELSTDLLTGRILLNLDTEDTGEVCIGCAGGGSISGYLHCDWENTKAGLDGIVVRVKGLSGGHSGIDIHRNRGNAIKLLARVLHAFSEKFPFFVAYINGGDKHNAIPREAMAALALRDVHAGNAESIVAELLPKLLAEFPNEPGLTISVERGATPDRVLGAETGMKLVRLLMSLHHGVMAMSRDIAGLVETSNNVASIKLEEDRFAIHNSPRSSQDNALVGALKQLQATFELAGADVETQPSYPGWQPNTGSNLLGIVEAVHEELFSFAPKRRAVHAGLECGLIGEKFPGMEMISIGPDIVNPHSPDEAVRIASVNDFWSLLKNTLQKLAE